MTSSVLHKYSWENDESEEAQLVVRTHERIGIIQKYHDDSTTARYGIEQTYAMVSKKYYCTGMKR